MKLVFRALFRTDLQSLSIAAVCLGTILGGLLVITLMFQDEPDVSAAVRYDTVLRWRETLESLDWSTQGFSALARKRPDFSGFEWERVSLPDTIPLPLQVSLTEAEPVARSWFKVNYTPPETLRPDEPIDVFVSRINGGAWSLYVNGELAASNSGDWRMQWNHPVHVSLPLSLSRSGQPVEIALAVPYRVNQGYALGTLQVGPSSAIVPLWEKRVFFQLVLPMVGMIATLLLGAFSFQFWLKCRREKQQLYMALASLAWGIFAIQFFRDIDSSSAGAQWFAAIVDSSASWMFLLMYLFALRIAKWPLPRFVPLMLGYALADTVLTLPVWHWQVTGFLFQHWLHIAFYLFICLHVSWLAVRRFRKEILVLSLSLWGCIASGIHDLMFPSSQVNPDAYHVTAYAVFFVFLAFNFANQNRHIEALVEVEEANRGLNQKLAQREAELKKKL